MNKDEKVLRMMIFGKLSPVLFALLIVFIGIVKECSNEVPDIDRLNAQHEMIKDVYILDDTHNGFRIRYSTANKVTQEELGDIIISDTVWQSVKQLDKDARSHFSNMVNLDIYEFAQFAKRYDHKDITIEYIFVAGFEKKKLYIGPHPTMKNSATWLDTATDQGILWINHNDIYFYDGKGHKTYRYYKCHSIYETSTTDEHFSHFSEDQRIH